MNMEEKKYIPEFVLKKMDDVMRLCHQTNVARIGLFGSALREDFDPEKSDLDFVVEFLSRMPLEFPIVTSHSQNP